MPISITASTRTVYALTFIGFITLLFYLAWSVGITPASKGEREFIDILKHSSFSNETHIKAAITVAEESPYISRQHFFAAKKAFDTVNH